MLATVVGTRTGSGPRMLVTTVTSSPTGAEGECRRGAAARRNHEGGFWVAKDDPSAAAEAVTHATPWSRFRGGAGAQMDERLDLLLRLLAGRVPVWVGGSSQTGAVARRAARADGVAPDKLTDTDRWSDFTAEEVAILAEAVAAHRTDAGHPASADIVVGGAPATAVRGGRARRHR